MAMSEHQLITPRRNFLIRALGFTAAGATVSIPVLLADSPEKRLAHHMEGVRRALGEMHPGVLMETSVAHPSWRGVTYPSQILASVSVSGKLELAADRSS
jgi:hypothetical protein